MWDFLVVISELLPPSHCFGLIPSFLFHRVKLAVKFREANPGELWMHL